MLALLPPCRVLLSDRALKWVVWSEFGTNPGPYKPFGREERQILVFVDNITMISESKAGDVVAPIMSLVHVDKNMQVGF